MIGSAFVFGLAAMTVVYALARAGRPDLGADAGAGGGWWVSAFFGALVSLVTYLADPNDSLPAIVFWLMGSFATATFDKALVIGTALGVLGKRAGRHAVPDQSPVAGRRGGLGAGRRRGAHAAGRPWSCVTGIVAASVAVAGIVGWVGLVVPHIARMLVGPRPPAAVAGGGGDRRDLHDPGRQRGADGDRGGDPAGRPDRYHRRARVRRPAAPHGDGRMADMTAQPTPDPVPAAAIEAEGLAHRWPGGAGVDVPRGLPSRRAGRNPGDPGPQRPGQDDAAEDADRAGAAGRRPGVDRRPCRLCAAELHDPVRLYGPRRRGDGPGAAHRPAVGPRAAPTTPRSTRRWRNSACPASPTGRRRRCRAESGRWC